MPPGTKENSKLRLIGMGRQTADGRGKGDLFLKVRVNNQP